MKAATWNNLTVVQVLLLKAEMLMDSSHIFVGIKDFVTCYQVELSFLRSKLHKSSKRDLRKISLHPHPLPAALRQLVLLSPEMARLQYLQVQRKVSVLAFYPSPSTLIEKHSH